MDYSIIVAALITGTLTVAGTIAAAKFGRRVAQTAGAAVQTAEQIEAQRLIADARTEALSVKGAAQVLADGVVRDAREEAERTKAERDAWHERQVNDLRAEITALKDDNSDLRRRIEDGKP